MEFPMLREKWIALFVTVSKYFLPLESNFFVRFEAVSHYISKNLEAVDHLVSEIKGFRINTPKYHSKIIRCDTGKNGEYKYVFFIGW